MAAPTRLSLTDAIFSLPPIYPNPPNSTLRAQIRTHLSQRSPPLPILVALDDDPTGTQICHDIPVLTVWDVPTLTAEFAQTPPGGGFFILTNSRTLHSEEAKDLVRCICRNLQEASRGARLEGKGGFEVVLRGDTESEAVEEVLWKADLWVLAPFFLQGGRYTIGDVHYVGENGVLVPAGETAFAKDATFRYQSSDLKDWVEEKSKGAMRKSNVTSITLNDVRMSGPERVSKKLTGFDKGSVVILNAAVEEDMDVAVLGILDAASKGRKFLFRTGAAFVSTRLGIDGTPPLDAHQLGIDEATSGGERTGGLIIAGSYVPKTTAQLNALVQKRGDKLKTVALDVEQLLESDYSAGKAIGETMITANKQLASGDVLIMTSRKLITGSDERESLNIGTVVARSLLDLANHLKIRPRYVIARGGITSSDMATKWLKMKRAMILRQAAPGVPLWRCDEDTCKNPGPPCVVFPGNVGSEDTIAEVVERWHI